MRGRSSESRCHSARASSQSSGGGLGRSERGAGSEPLMGRFPGLPLMSFRWVGVGLRPRTAKPLEQAPENIGAQKGDDREHEGDLKVGRETDGKVETRVDSQLRSNGENVTNDDVRRCLQE